MCVYTVRLFVHPRPLFTPSFFPCSDRVRRPGSVPERDRSRARNHQRGGQTTYQHGGNRGRRPDDDGRGQRGRERDQQRHDSGGAAGGREGSRYDAGQAVRP